MRALLTSLVLSLLAALPLSAQTRAEPAATILVLDASGSMWGQIDGVNKIVIAREVISDLLPQFPEDMALGLTMYGHNRRGDCSDIETMVEPGLNNRDEIARIVNSVNPRGSTPLSAAVIQAAEQLRHTESPATVILVSDGRETCEMDPCAIGRMLEETGIDFTAHVIGFDVAEPESIAQLQCLAENTGGQFLTADNAEELAQALSQVAVAPTPPPMTDVTLRAVVLPDRSQPVSPLVWEIFDSAGVTVGARIEAPSIQATLPPGDYQVWLTRVATGTQHGGPITVSAAGPQEFLFELPQLVPEASLTAPAEAPVGSDIPVQWTGPGLPEDYILLATPDRSASFRQVFVRDGNPLMVTMPDAPGDYLLQYVHPAMNRVLAEAPIRATPPPATLVGPQAGIAGSTQSYDWTGPGSDGDWIGFYDPENVSNHSYEAITRAEATDGQPTVSLRLPPRPGTYELRYVHQTGRQVLARLTVQVTPAMATLSAASPGVAGAETGIGWTGPGYDGDWIGFYPTDNTANHSYDAITRIEVDGPEGELPLRYPPHPGTYELRYVMELGRTVLARQVVEVTDVSATLEAPQTALAGSEIAVDWTGPGYDGDWIGLYATENTTNHSYEAVGGRAEVMAGEPSVAVALPATPGVYEIRYIMELGRRPLASRMIEVLEVIGTLEAPVTAEAGSTVAVHWTGPDYQNDFIAVSRMDDPRDYENYAYTRDGTPALVVMPTEPGEYELRYFVNQDRTIIARHPITLTAVGATLEAPETAEAGSTVSVTWTGPDYRNDFIGIGPADDPNGYQNYAYTRDGSPVTVTMPTEPGDYEIRYFVNQDRTVIARHPITLTAVGATLEAPETAEAGSTVLVRWTGPDYRNDFIGIGVPDDPDGYRNYAYTRDGSPARLTMPTEPGDYEIRYFINQDRTVIARHPITLTAVGATIEAPERAVAGDTISVTWTGPDYRNDFIGIGPLDDPDGYRNYAYTRDGSPARVEMPVEPGTYELRYFVNQDRTVIARRQIEVAPLSVTLSAPETALAGDTIMVTWDGPDYRNDFVAAATPDEDRYETYAYTRDGSPARLQMPSEPGTYEIRYYVNQDRSIQARVQITVQDVTATITTETAGPAGGAISVAWTGPNYRNDFLGIGPLGEDGYDTYAYTRDGSPLRLNLPDEPGEYEIRYYMNQDRRVIARVPFTVTAP